MRHVFFRKHYAKAKRMLLSVEQIPPALGHNGGTPLSATHYWDCRLHFSFVDV